MKLRDEETGQLYDIYCEHDRDHDLTLHEAKEDRSKWHPHHDLIVAWARGAEIQYLNPASNEWLDIMFNSPSWKVSIKYRIKPDNSEKIAKAEKNFRWLENEVNDLKRKLAKLRG